MRQQEPDSGELNRMLMTVLVLIFCAVLTINVDASCKGNGLSQLKIPSKLLEPSVSSNETGTHLKLIVKGHYYGGIPYRKAYQFKCMGNTAKLVVKKYKAHGNNLFDHSGSNGKLNTNWR